MREFENKDLAALDNLSTEDLMKILESEAALELDGDVLLYIMKILESRDSLLVPPVTEEDALKSLKNDYLPSDVYDCCPNSENTASNIITMEEVNHKASRRIFGSRALKSLITAVLAIAAVFTLSFGAMAAGVDVFGAIARWTEDLFGFERYDEDASVNSALSGDKVAPVLEKLYQDLSSNGVTADILPAYIPDGYGVREYSCNIFPTFDAYTCVLNNGESSITLSYIAYKTEDAHGNDYHKNTGDPEEYIVNEITHYIMSNDGENRIAWMNGNIECSISGMVSEDVLIDILESIYEG